MIIPLAADLRVGSKPVVTICIIAICLIIHYFQDDSRKGVATAAGSYCADVAISDESSTDWSAADIEECEVTLQWIHNWGGDRELFTRFLETHSDDLGETTLYGLRRQMDELWAHYGAFEQTAPASLDAYLMDFPSTPNPLRMLTSSVAHADWEHVIFNLIFYFAFAAALEILIGNALLYLAIMATIAVATSLAYSVYTALFAFPVPSLGLSGVVMGMIGLSAYLMPRARIRTFIWFFTVIGTLFIPAWVLAVFYIGWDAYYMVTQENAGETNLVAHVAGGVSGYLLGYWWLRDRKWLVAEQLDDEIDYMHSKRTETTYSRFPSHVNRRALREWDAEDKARRHKQAFDDVLERVYRLNKTNQYQKALCVLLEGLQAYGESAESLSSVFDTVLEWRHTLFTLNFARHYIDFLLAQKRQRDALNVCEKCFAFAPEFILKNPFDVLPLARAAERQQRYRLAYSLVQNTKDRYGDALDQIPVQEMEARLARYLEDSDVVTQLHR